MSSGWKVFDLIVSSLLLLFELKIKSTLPLVLPVSACTLVRAEMGINNRESLVLRQSN